MPAPIKAAYLDTALGQIHYFYSEPEAGGGGGDSAGDGKSGEAPLPVLLLHMSASSAKSMAAMMPLLTARGFACYAPDMPGFGGSFDPAADPPAIAWYAALYRGAFGALPAFARGCHLIGHHSGGILGMELASNTAAYGAAYEAAAHGVAAHGAAASDNPFVRSLTVVGASVMTAADRAAMAKAFLDPFNRPVPSGAHLLQTWEYLVWEGLPRQPEPHTALLQRETLDHLRAWRGRHQIYACVWAYDAAAALGAVPSAVPVAGVCARDDVLWPFYDNFRTLVARDVQTAEIKGGNFGPDLDPDGIVQAFLRLLPSV